MARGKQVVATLDHALDVGEDKTEYLGFPPFEQKYTEAPYRIELHLETEEDLKEFVKRVEGFKTLLYAGKQSIKSYWYPELESGERGSSVKYVWVEEEENV